MCTSSHENYPVCNMDEYNYLLCNLSVLEAYVAINCNTVVSPHMLLSVQHLHQSKSNTKQPKSRNVCVKACVSNFKPPCPKTVKTQDFPTISRTVLLNILLRNSGVPRILVKNVTSVCFEESVSQACQQTYLNSALFLNCFTFNLGDSGFELIRSGVGRIVGLYSDFVAIVQINLWGQTFKILISEDVFTCLKKGIPLKQYLDENCTVYYDGQVSTVENISTLVVTKAWLSYSSPVNPMDFSARNLRSVALSDYNGKVVHLFSELSGIIEFTYNDSKLTFPFERDVLDDFLPFGSKVKFDSLLIFIDHEPVFVNLFAMWTGKKPRPDVAAGNRHVYLSCVTPPGIISLRHSSVKHNGELKGRIHDYKEDGYSKTKRKIKPLLDAESDSQIIDKKQIQTGLEVDNSDVRYMGMIDTFDEVSGFVNFHVNSAVETALFTRNAVYLDGVKIDKKILLADILHSGAFVQIRVAKFKEDYGLHKVKYRALFLYCHRLYSGIIKCNLDNKFIVWFANDSSVEEAEFYKNRDLYNGYGQKENYEKTSEKLLEKDSNVNVYVEFRGRDAKPEFSVILINKHTSIKSQVRFRYPEVMKEPNFYSPDEARKYAVNKHIITAVEGKVISYEAGGVGIVCCNIRGITRNLHFTKESVFFQEDLNKSNFVNKTVLLDVVVYDPEFKAYDVIYLWMTNEVRGHGDVSVTLCGATRKKGENSHIPQDVCSDVLLGLPGMVKLYTSPDKGVLECVTPQGVWKLQFHKDMVYFPDYKSSLYLKQYLPVGTKVFFNARLVTTKSKNGLIVTSLWAKTNQVIEEKFENFAGQPVKKNITDIKDSENETPFQASNNAAGLLPGNNIIKNVAPHITEQTSDKKVILQRLVGKTTSSGAVVRDTSNKLEKECELFDKEAKIAAFERENTVLFFYYIFGTKNKVRFYRNAVPHVPHDTPLCSYFRLNEKIRFDAVVSKSRGEVIFEVTKVSRPGSISERNSKTANFLNSKLSNANVAKVHEPRTSVYFATVVAVKETFLTFYVVDNGKVYNGRVSHVNFEKSPYCINLDQGDNLRNYVSADNQIFVEGKLRVGKKKSFKVNRAWRTRVPLQDVENKNRFKTKVSSRENQEMERVKTEENLNEDVESESDCSDAESDLDPYSETTETCSEDDEHEAAQIGDDNETAQNDDDYETDQNDNETAQNNDDNETAQNDDDNETAQNDYDNKTAQTGDDNETDQNDDDNETDQNVNDIEAEIEEYLDRNEINIQDVSVEEETEQESQTVRDSDSSIATVFSVDYDRMVVKTSNYRELLFLRECVSLFGVFLSNYDLRQIFFADEPLECTLPFNNTQLQIGSCSSAEDNIQGLMSFCERKRLSTSLRNKLVRDLGRVSVREESPSRNLHSDIESSARLVRQVQNTSLQQHSSESVMLEAENASLQNCEKNISFLPLQSDHFAVDGNKFIAQETMVSDTYNGTLSCDNIDIFHSDFRQMLMSVLIEKFSQTESDKPTSYRVNEIARYLNSKMHSLIFSKLEQTLLSILCKRFSSGHVVENRNSTDAAGFITNNIPNEGVVLVRNFIDTLKHTIENSSQMSLDNSLLLDNEQPSASNLRKDEIVQTISTGDIMTLNYNSIN